MTSGHAQLTVCLCGLCDPWASWPHKQPGRQWPQALWRQGWPLTSGHSPEQNKPTTTHGSVFLCASEKAACANTTITTPTPAPNAMASSVQPLNPHSCVSVHLNVPRQRQTQHRLFGMRTKFGCPWEECLPHKVIIIKCLAQLSAHFVTMGATHHRWLFLSYFLVILQVW